MIYLYHSYKHLYCISAIAKLYLYSEFMTMDILLYIYIYIYTCVCVCVYGDSLGINNTIIIIQIYRILHH